MKKAFSNFIIKSFDEEQGIIRGIATTPTTDKVGDVIEPQGVQFTLPIPLHHEHDRKDVVGQVIEANVTPEGIEFVAQVAKDVSEQIAEVWRRVKGGLIRFVSVGFRPIEYKQIDGGFHFLKWAWDELSLTTIPANPQAAIVAVKSASHVQKEKNTMTISEQIASFLAKRAELIGKMDALITKGVTLQGDDETAFKQHEAEVAEIDKHLERLKAAEARQAQTAAPVSGIKSIVVESNLPKGVGYIAACKALSEAKGNPYYAAELAKAHYKDYPQVEQFIRTKAAVAGATTTSHDALVTPGALANEFIDLLYAPTIVGRLKGFRQVPHGTKIPRLASAAAAYWVEEGKPIPLSITAVDDIEVSRFKIAGMTAMTRELLAIGNPAIDALTRDNIIEKASALVDNAFILSTNAGSSGMPAAITYGLTPVPASGTGPQHVRADVKKALDKFTIANQGVNGAVWVMHSATASALTFMRNPMGAAAFPGMAIDGGTLLGLPVLVSNSVPGNSTDGYDMVLVKASEIFRPLVPGVDVAMSTEASLEMLDASLLQDGTDGTGANLVSMFQNDMTAVRVILFDGWYPRRTPCAVRISATKYDETVIETIAAVTVTP